MKLLKRIKHITIAAALMCSAMLLVACAGGDVEYKVTVKDALGNPYGDEVLVLFMQDGKQVAMQVCDENGVAAKTIEAGTYDIELKFTDKDATYHYEKGTTVSGSSPEAEVQLAYATGEEKENLFVSNEDHTAYHVNSGCTAVELEKGERNYFLFTPQEAGTYEFSVVSDADTEIGYYGTPHFVQTTSAAEVVDGKFTISVSESMIGTGDTGTTVLVIGVEAMEEANHAVLCINRIGDAEVTLADMPWTIYEKTVEISKYTLPAGSTIKEFDITSAAGYTLVFNEADGFYHLNTADGPLVVVRLAKDPKYLPCFKNILDRSDVNKYFFDDKGEFVKKERYSQCLLEYIECADDAEGVYPLTEDLKYIIQSRGEYVGWWDEDSHDFIFMNENGAPIPGLNKEIAWLFMCAYIE